MAIFPGLPRWAGTRKVKPVWILLKQETVSGGGISWAVCRSAPCSRQITMPAPHHSVFYRPDALPAAQPTASKYLHTNMIIIIREKKIIIINVFVWHRKVVTLEALGPGSVLLRKVREKAWEKRNVFSLDLNIITDSFQ